MLLMAFKSVSKLGTCMKMINDGRFTYFMDNITATICLNNVFDEDPPFAETGFNDNTDPRTYNTTGRHVYVNFGVKF